MVERGLAMHDKPLVLLNQDGYYDGLLTYFQRMVSERFKSAGFSSLFGVADTADEVWPLLENPAVFQADSLWQNKLAKLDNA